MVNQEQMNEILADIIKGTLTQTLNGQKITALRSSSSADKQNLMLAIANRYAMDEKNAMEVLGVIRACGISFEPTVSWSANGGVGAMPGMPGNLADNLLGRVEQSECNALHLAVFYKSPEKAIRFLITQGYDINLACNNLGSQPGGNTISMPLLGMIDAMSYQRVVTPLAIAVYLNDLECAQLLLSLGADPNPTSTHGKQFSPLFIACLIGSLPMIELLLKAGADLESNPILCDSPLTSLVSNPQFFKNPKDLVARLTKEKFGLTKEMIKSLSQVLCEQTKISLELGLPDPNLEPTVPAKKADSKEDAETDEAVAVTTHVDNHTPNNPGLGLVPTPGAAANVAIVRRQPTHTDRDLLEIYEMMKNSFADRLKEIQQIIMDIVLQQGEKQIAGVITEYAFGEEFADQPQPLIFMRRVVNPRNASKNSTPENSLGKSAGNNADPKEKTEKKRK